MANAVAAGRTGGFTGRAVMAIARQRELSLVLLMLALSIFVAIQAPQFLTTGNLIAVTSVAAIIAVAAVGEALVVITRNVDLSVESTIGLVALVVAEILSRDLLPIPVAW